MLVLRPWGTVSKALEKSKIAISTCLLLSKDAREEAVRRLSEVSWRVELRRLCSTGRRRRSRKTIGRAKTWFNLVRMLLDSRCVKIWRQMMCSIFLRWLGEMGLYRVMSVFADGLAGSERHWCLGQTGCCRLLLRHVPVFSLNPDYAKLFPVISSQFSFSSSVNVKIQTIYRWPVPALPELQLCPRCGLKRHIDRGQPQPQPPGQTFLHVTTLLVPDEYLVTREHLFAKIFIQ